MTSMECKVGDKILFGKYAGEVVIIEREELLIMRKNDIMAAVESLTRVIK